MEDISAAQAAFCFVLFFFVIKFMLSNVSTRYSVNGKPHTWSKKVPPFQAASINYSNVFNLQYSGIFSDHGSKSSM